MPPRARILLADDEPMNLMILESLLEDDYDLVQVDTGEAALEALQQSLASGETIDAVLMDVLMPGMGGYAACQVIRATPALAHLPVLFLSSLSSPADEAKGLQAGASDFIHKPFSPAVIELRVRHHLRLQAMARVLAQHGLSVD